MNRILDGLGVLCMDLLLYVTEETSLPPPPDSRNLLFADGKRMQRLFATVVDRTRSRLSVTKLRTIFGAKQRPHHDRVCGPPGSQP